MGFNGVSTLGCPRALRVELALVPQEWRVELARDPRGAIGMAGNPRGLCKRARVFWWLKIVQGSVSKEALGVLRFEHWSWDPLFSCAAAGAAVLVQRDLQARLVPKLFAQYEQRLLKFDSWAVVNAL